MSLNEVLQQVYDEEETDKIVYSIREEIMERVMEECFRSYIEKQTIRFIVQCTYDALVKFLCLNFYYHYEAPDVNDPIWSPDEPIEPSPRDTWAYGAVPVRPRYFKDGSTDEDHIETDPARGSGDDRAHCLCPGNICQCRESYTNVLKQSNLSAERPHPSRVKFSPVSSKVQLTEKTESKKDVFRPSAASSEISSVNKSSTDDTAKSQTEGLLASREQIIKKKKEKAPSKDTKFEIPTAVERGSLASIVGLPPIRVNTKIYSKPEEKQKKKK